MGGGGPHNNVFWILQCFAKDLEILRDDLILWNTKERKLTVMRLKNFSLNLGGIPGGWIDLFRMVPCFLPTQLQVSNDNSIRTTLLKHKVLTLFDT